MDAAVTTNAEDDYLAHVQTLIERAIRRRWSSGLITRDADGAVLGAEDIERLLVAPRFDHTELLADHTYAPGSAVGTLAGRLQLRPTQADLIALLLACENDAVINRLVTYLGGNQEQFNLTLELVFDIIYRSRRRAQHEASELLHGDLSPTGFLRRLQFVLLDGADRRITLAQGIRLHPRLVAWLMRQGFMDADLTSMSQIYPPIDPEGEVDPKVLAEVVEALSSPGRLLVVEGPPESGREMLLRFAAAKVMRPLLVVNCRNLTPEHVVATFREALLHRSLLALRAPDELLEGDKVKRFRECLEAFPGTVALIGAVRRNQLTAGRPVTTVTVEVPRHTERLRLWRTQLGGALELSEQQIEEVASLYNLGIAGIINASRVAKDIASRDGGRVKRPHLARAVRQLFDADLSAVATRVEVSQTWEDLVLSEEIGESVVDIIDRIRHRNSLLGKWGFARKLGKGLGINVLFSGQPGTGKSMLAGLIAAELGLDLYVIDLARVTSKWLGETEKNLAHAFDAAEAGHVLLLFDEADSVLGRRSSEIRSSNDRHANLETNFILARLETFQGLAFFTTNLPSAIDPAISRRMAVHVTFPFPDIKTRAELWERMIPHEAPVAANVDFTWLAAHYELAGGFIRNIVLRAAYAAHRGGQPIDMAHLRRAAELEYHERGSLVVGGRLA